MLLLPLLAPNIQSNNVVSCPLTTSPNKATLWAHEILERTNKIRVAQGLPPLGLNLNLSSAASDHAAEMESKGYFSHTDKQGGQPWDRMARHGYVGHTRAAENIAQGNANAEKVVQMWMKSEGHRANILNPELREIGVGCVITTRRGFGQFVQCFGTIPDIFPVVVNLGAAETSSAKVKLHLHGKEKVTMIRLSNDGTRFSEWEPFAQERSWELSSGVGLKTVSVECRHSSGVSTYSASILLRPSANKPK